MNALVVFAHPDPESYNRALADAVVRGLSSAGHQVSFLDLYALDYAGALSPAEWTAYTSDQPIVDPMVAEHARLVKQAEILVFVYPTWWSGLPAVLKGWLDKVMIPGVAFSLDARAKVRPGLTHVRRIVAVSTYGSPWRYVRFVNDNGRRILFRALRMSTGWRARTSFVGLYSMDTATASDRERHLARVAEVMGSL